MIKNRPVGWIIAKQQYGTVVSGDDTFCTQKTVGGVLMNEAADAAEKRVSARIARRVRFIPKFQPEEQQAQQ